MDTDRPIALNHCRVLAVDDHAVNRQFLVATLEDEVAALALAASGREAIERCRGDRFDLVLMDLHLTDMDGVETWSQLRREPGLAGARVLALTADTREQQRDRVRRAAFHGLLGKPIEPGELLTALHQALKPDADFVVVSGTSRPATLLIDMYRAERASGSRDGARAIQRALAEELERDAPALDRELASGRWSDAARRLHQWRGACGYAGAGLLDQACRQLEEALEADSAASSERIGPACFELKRALEASCSAIRIDAEGAPD